MQNWKWDWLHIVIIVMYIVGVMLGIITVYPNLRSENGPQLAMTLGIIAVSAIMAFFKSPPKDAVSALQSGEQTAEDQVRLPANPPIQTPSVKPPSIDGMKTILVFVIAGSMFAGILSGASAIQGCNMPTKTVQDVAVGLDFGTCILDTYAVDQGMPWADIIADEIKRCGGDAVAIEKVLAAHKRAMAAELADAGTKTEKILIVPGGK